MIVPVKRTLKRFLYRTKAYRLGSVLNRSYILAYHMIADRPNGFYPETPTRAFETHVLHLVRNYEIVSLDELARRLANRESLRGRVAVTFDDGFRDNYEKAYPILKKNNIPATIFLSTGLIDNGNVPWFIRVRHMFMKTARTQLHPPWSPNSQIGMLTPHERFGASEIVMKHLMDCSEATRNTLLDELSKDLRIDGPDNPGNLMLSWDQIKEMAENGISFGAHTVSHPVLASIGLEEVEREIRESKDAIERMLSRRVSTFAYPFGKSRHYHSCVFPILEKLRFGCSVTTEQGANRPQTNRFELKRDIPRELLWMG